ncbi:MAG: TolC family protein [Bacteroidota bacterium]|nr:TolC family protein [Bacteroidota bacterium]
MTGKRNNLNKIINGLIWILLLFFFNRLQAQTLNNTLRDTLPSEVTLPQCLKYALANQSLIKQSLIDEDITKRNIRLSLSDWYPQLEFDASLQHYFKVPIASYPNLLDPSGPPVKLPGAADYGSSMIFYANQTLYSTSLLYTAKTSRELRTQASQNTENSKINTYVDVTKAFFNVLLSEEQIKVLNEDIIRLQRNYKDAYNLYQNGLTDNIDFQRASISLSNVEAQKKSAEEALKAKYSVLKQVMGVAPEKQLTVSYDSSQYQNEILIDTAKILDYNNRIEYKLMQSALNLQNSQISYYRFSFLPTLSAFYNYNLQYGNNEFSNLFEMSSPSSLLGMKLTFPLFQGMNRMENLNKAKLQYTRLELGMDYLKSQINSEYSLALSGYKSNLNELRVAKRNIATAIKIYSTVKLQYDKGIKAYLEVIVSETDLRTAELNYLNVLYQVLTSKIDLEKALGLIINI